MKIAISQIHPSPESIRKSWDEEKLQELAQSIQEQGLIVPIKVRPTDYRNSVLIDDSNGRDRVVGSEVHPVKYEIVYGHRRFEAAKRAGLAEIEATVEGLNDTDALVQALIENLQREDMEPIETANALKVLQRTTGWSQREIARQGILPYRAVGLHLALLDELPEVQEMVTRQARGRKTDAINDHTIGEGHVRAVRHTGLEPEQRLDVLKKAAQEQLTAAEAQRVAETYGKAHTEEERQAVLRTSGKNPAFDRAVHVQMAVDRADEIDRHKVRKEHEDNDDEVKEVIDTAKEFRRAVIAMSAHVRSMIDYGKFSPEARRYFARSIDTLIEELQELRKELTDE